MTIVYFLVPYVIILFSIIMRSNLTAYIGLLMLGVLAASHMKRKWFAVLLMTLQAICSAGIIYLNINNYTQSNYLLFIGVISIIMLVSMGFEMIVDRNKHCHVSWFKKNNTVCLNYSNRGVLSYCLLIFHFNFFFNDICNKWDALNLPFPRTVGFSYKSF